MIPPYWTTYEYTGSGLCSLPSAGLLLYAAGKLLPPSGGWKPVGTTAGPSFHAVVGSDDITSVFEVVL
jgi:hypothetical protein